jgi:hypothetical protein
MERRNKNLVGLLQLLEEPTKYLSKRSGLFILPDVLDLLEEATQIYARLFPCPATGWKVYLFERKS